MAKAREERADEAAQHAARLIRQYVPASAERHAVLLKIGDQKAICEQLVCDEQRRYEEDIESLERQLEMLKAKDQKKRLKEKGLEHLIKETQ